MDSVGIDAGSCKKADGNGGKNRSHQAKLIRANPT